MLQGLFSHIEVRNLSSRFYFRSHLKIKILVQDQDETEF